MLEAGRLLQLRLLTEFVVLYSMQESTEGDTGAHVVQVGVPRQK